MKKVFLVLTAAAFTFGFTSCSSEECCDCSSISDDPNVEIEGGDEICEDDVEDAGGDWGQMKDLYSGFGCDCD